MTNYKKQCWLCDSLEIINESCARCHKAYCKDCSNKIDPANYCDDCMRDITIEQKVYDKNTTEWDIWRDELRVQGHRAKVIQFKGIDWMWAAKRICEMSLEDEKEILLYHKAIVCHLENDIATKEVLQAKEEAASTDTKKLFQIQQQTVKKTTRVAKPVVDRNMEKLVQLAMKHGISSGAELQAFLDQIKNKEKVN